MKKALVYLHLILPIFLYSIFAFKDMSLPGLYMDAVNPDYQAVWISRGQQTIPAWIYSDNYFFGKYRYPLLNSLYGGNITTYVGLLFFKITGFGIVEVRFFHVVIGVILLSALAWALLQWKVKKLWIALCLGLCAVDPNFIFAWRTQYYLQLVPLIFFALSIGLLGKHYHIFNASKKSERSLLYAGILFGFAAYLYFIFAFYAAAAVLSYAFIARKKLNSIRKLSPLFFGVMIGWLPFLYAHVSIMFNAGFQSYLDQIQSLQTTYGVVDASQGGFLGRLKIVWDRLNLLPAGEGIQRNIFGDFNNPISFSSSGILFLLFGPFLCLIGIVFDAFRGDAEHTQPENSCKPFIILLWSVVLSHLILGVAVGRPLGLQHYIMLLPILYVMLAVSSCWVALQVQKGKIVQRLYKNVLILIVILAFAFNITSVLQFRERMQTTGGNGMYSDVINVAAANLRNVPRSTALLFPQWGYWMGIVMALGPTHSIYETPGLLQMEKRLNSEPELIRKNHFIIAIGATTAVDDESKLAATVAALVHRTHLKLGRMTKCIGRNGVDQIWLVELSR